jgi:thioredoxin-related protein
VFLGAIGLGPFGLGPLKSAPLWAAGSPGDFAEGVSTHPYDAALKKAKLENKVTFIYFWTPSCPWCRAFSELVLTDPDVRDFLNDAFVVVSVNADRERKLAKKYRLPSVPYLVFLDSSGEAVYAIPQPLDADVFLVFLEYLRTGSYLNQDFEGFVKTLSQTPST